MLWKGGELSPHGKKKKKKNWATDTVEIQTGETIESFDQWKTPYNYAI